jgi:aldose 1-epimerase
MFGKITKELFGKTQIETPVFQYTLENKNGMIVKALNFGGIITNIWVKDKFGKYVDVVLGFDNLEEYEKLNHKYYFGAVIGRYANRIKNGQFKIDDTIYQLALNDGKNSLHGGIGGFHTKIFKTSTEITPYGPKLKLKYLSHDGEEGFPGNLLVNVIYTLTNNNELIIEYIAQTDKPTVVNLTQHSYFNLSGKGCIYDHKIQINADLYTPVDENLVPTGEIVPVENTPYDFKQPKNLGKMLEKIDYDVNFVLNKSKIAAVVSSLETGIKLEVSTTKPGIQLYTGNFLDNIIGKSGNVYKKHSGLCLETQYFPDSPNKKNFPNVILKKGDIYYHKTTFKFTVEQ